MATTEWPAERVRKTFVEYFEKQCDHVNYVSSPVGEQLGRGGAARRDAGGGGRRQRCGAASRTVAQHTRRGRDRRFSPPTPCPPAPPPA